MFQQEFWNLWENDFKKFVSSNFGDYSLLWMFHRNKQNSTIEELDQMASAILYQSYASSFPEFSEKYNLTAYLTEVFYY